MVIRRYRQAPKTRVHTMPICLMSPNQFMLLMLLLNPFALLMLMLDHNQTTQASV